jgi:hypothetical protein
MKLGSAKQLFGQSAVAVGALIFLLLPALRYQRIVLSAIDFKAVYSSSKCVLDGCDPYDSNNLLREYTMGRGDLSPNSDLSFDSHQALYPPSSLFWVLPFALLPFKAALVAWLALSGSLFVTAAFLMAEILRQRSSPIALVLLGLFVATSSLLLYTAQPSGVAISLCAIGVWSLVRRRIPFTGAICFALSLALKPQIGGLVLIYFLLSKGPSRHRAVLILILAALFCVPGLFWITRIHAAAQWQHELAANLARGAARGSINDPGPSGPAPNLVTDLQSVIAVFADDPAFYNRISLAIVGVLLLLWGYVAVRAKPSLRKDLLGIAAIACLSLLPIYHRNYDLRLLLLTFPALGLLVADGGAPGILAVLVSVAILPASHPTGLHLGSHFRAQNTVQILLLLRPAPLAVLSSALIYLSCFALTLRTERESTSAVKQPAQIR